MYPRCKIWFFCKNGSKIFEQRDIQNEFNQKRKKLIELLKIKNLDGIYLTKNKNFSWLFGGAQHHINIATEFTASKIFVNKENVIIESNNIENPRLKDEELEFNDFIKYKSHY